jgi:hypothetical protein
VTFLPRYSVSIVVILAATLATFAVFTFARPEYHPRYESKMIDFSTQDYYSPAEVRQAFSAHGIKLRGVTGPARGFLLLSNAPAPWTADVLQVVMHRTTAREASVQRSSPTTSASATSWSRTAARTSGCWTE